MQDQRIDIVMKAAANGFSVTEDAINELQAETHRDPMSVLDRILCVMAVGNKRIITVEHVRIAVWSYVMDELIRRHILPTTNHSMEEGTRNE